MKNWHWFDTVYVVLLAVAGVAAVVFIAFGIRDCSAQSRCESLGGRVEVRLPDGLDDRVVRLGLHDDLARRDMQMAVRRRTGRAMTYTP